MKNLQQLLQMTNDQRLKVDYSKMADTTLYDLWKDLMFEKPVRPVPKLLDKEVKGRKLVKTYPNGSIFAPHS